MYNKLSTLYTFFLFIYLFLHSCRFFVGGLKEIALLASRVSSFFLLMQKTQFKNIEIVVVIKLHITFLTKFNTINKI